MDSNNTNSPNILDSRIGFSIMDSDTQPGRAPFVAVQASHSGCEALGSICFAVPESCHPNAASQIWIQKLAPVANLRYPDVCVAIEYQTAYPVGLPSSRPKTIYHSHHSHNCPLLHTPTSPQPQSHPTDITYLLSWFEFIDY